MTRSSDPATTDPWAQAHRPVVVGVDGSDGSGSALAWAAAEAAATGADLRLATAVERHRTRAEGYLRRAADSVVGTVPAERVSTVIYTGHATPELLDHLDDARLLVVGRRGRGAIPRMLVGSTSVALAGRCPVPVAVVPTGWDVAAHVHEPLVLGLDPEHPHEHLLRLAFTRAQRLQVPLVVVHGTEAEARPGHQGPEGTTRPEDTVVRDQLTEVLDQWRDRFPQVEVRPVATSSPPAMALLAEAERGAQLLILGRRTHSPEGGFGFGSVTHAVLHYTAMPVLVVPAEQDGS